MKKKVLIATLGILIAAATFAPGVRAEAVACSDSSDAVNQLFVTVEGQKASGFVALPSAEPKGIVAFAHGYGSTALAWVHHLRWAARELGVIAIAMDNRGLKITPQEKEGDLPSSRGWNVSAGAADNIAATQRYEKCATGKPNVMFGVSMGGNTSGVVVAEGVQRAAPASGPLFDYWFDIEGVTNVTSTYTFARVLAPANATGAKAVEDITEEMGGPIEAVPEEYAKRSIVTRGDDIAAGGLKGVLMVHSVEDGLVGYEQSRYMVAALDRVGVPVQLYSVLRRTEESEQDTTYSGYVGKPLDPSYKSPLAGHASDKSAVHIVMKTAFDRLVALYNGELPICRSEHVVDADSPITPAPGPC